MISKYFSEDLVHLETFKQSLLMIHSNYTNIMIAYNNKSLSPEQSSTLVNNLMQETKNIDDIIRAHVERDFL